MSALSSTPGSLEAEPPLPRPTVVTGSCPSSRASSRARSAHSSAPASRSASPAVQQELRARLRGAESSSASSLRSASSGSHEAGPSSRSLRSRSRPLEQPSSRTALDTSHVVEISSDSSDDDDVVPLGPYSVPRPRTSDFEVSSIRRVTSTAPLLRSDIFSPPPPIGRPAEPPLLDASRGGRMLGVSADPNTGDFLTRPMPIVRPRSATSHSVNDDTFSIMSAYAAPSPPPPPRSAHPITDQRLRSTNLAMPTRSPPRSKPPPIEHPLLSTYTCPICFDAPTNLSVTPCGHFFCGECLFQALKTQAVQRGAMEEEESFFNFSLFSPFAPAGTFGAGRGGGAGSGAAAIDTSGAGGRGGAAAGVGRGRGGVRGGGAGGAGGGRGRNKPDPLAGQCPVCRAKIKGAFNGREKNGIVGLRLAIGKPVDDPREESGKMKSYQVERDDGSVSSSGSQDDEMTLPTNKLYSDEASRLQPRRTEEDKHQSISDDRAARRKRRSSGNVSGSAIQRSLSTRGVEAQESKRQRQDSDSSGTQTE